MKTTQQYEKILDILNHWKGIKELFLDEENIFYYENGPDYFDEECIFDGCADSFVIEILNSFLVKKIEPGWLVLCELSKLLSKRGELVASIVEPIILDDWNSGFSERFLFYSYFGTSKKWENHCVDLLDLLPEDSRDGVFLACYRLNTKKIYQKLVNQFTVWGKSEDFREGGTGEVHALKCFINKWNRTPDFNLHKHLSQLVKDL